MNQHTAYTAGVPAGTPAHREFVYWCDTDSGLGVRITPEGKSSTRRRYFVFGFMSPRTGKWRRMSLGKTSRCPDLDQIKAEVFDLNIMVRKGKDPIDEREAKRKRAAQAVTMEDLAKKAMTEHFDTTWEIPPAYAESRFARAERSRWVKWVIPEVGNTPVWEASIRPEPSVVG